MGNPDPNPNQTAAWVTALSATRALVCYGAGSHADQGWCTLLSRASTSATSLSVGATAVFHAGSTSAPSVAALDAQLALQLVESAVRPV